MSKIGCLIYGISHLPNIVKGLVKKYGNCNVRCIGVRDQFRLGGGGAEVSCPNILSIACSKIKWFCPNIT